ncbi:MAG: DNA replication and repair protein RecF [Planctomycetota bacterium]|jgi:DNA replication and repair protein RecF
MSISQLSLTDFRNIKSSTLDFDPDVNLIYGNNGSGKTSLLEAIYVICRACSFRTHQLKKCISHDQSGFLLFAKFGNYKAGLSKNQHKLEIKVNNETIMRRSDLVRRTPINIFNSSSFELLYGSPLQRRQFIDWCLFHVEPNYSKHWLDFNHALKQRNRILRTKIDLNLIDYWDQHLVRPALEISHLRKKYCDILEQTLTGELCEMATGLDFKMAYKEGWSKGTELAEALSSNRARDIKAGFTSSGIHRDDIVFTTLDRPVSEVLSRGQCKRMSLALMLASLLLVQKYSVNKIILLIDDLHSELDIIRQTEVYDHLLNLNMQLFISNISDAIPSSMKTKEVKMFHVEHGIIKPRKFT